MTRYKPIDIGTRGDDMPRYILIESNSGFIWADTASLPGWDESDQQPVDAARLIDEHLGVPAREYEFFRSSLGAPAGSGYHVWRVDAADRGIPVLPVVTDGQDRETIAAVTLREFVGYIHIIEPA